MNHSIQKNNKSINFKITKNDLLVNRNIFEKDMSLAKINYAYKITKTVQGFLLTPKRFFKQAFFHKNIYNNYTNNYNTNDYTLITQSKATTMQELLEEINTLNEEIKRTKQEYDLSQNKDDEKYKDLLAKKSAFITQRLNALSQKFDELNEGNDTNLEDDSMAKPQMQSQVIQTAAQTQGAKQGALGKGIVIEDDDNQIDILIKIITQNIKQKINAESISDFFSKTKDTVINKAKKMKKRKKVKFNANLDSRKIKIIFLNNKTIK